MVEKLKNFNSVEKIQNGVYIFDEDVVVAWSDTGSRDIDLSNYFEGDVRTTEIITERGVIDPQIIIQNSLNVYIQSLVNV